MITYTSTILLIDGREIRSYDSINLNQEIDKHHSLLVSFRMDAIEKDDSKEIGNESKEMLGKVIALQIKSYNDNKEINKLEFTGLITKVNIKKSVNKSLGDHIELIGQSPTILIDDGCHMDSFNEMTLHDIVSKTLEFCDTPTSINPRLSDVIHYCVQHNESSFDYLRRLSKQYGEWFYYDGENVVFGKPENEKVLLVYGMDLEQFNITLNPKPQNYTFISNDYLNDTILEEEVNSDSSNDSQFNGALSSAANNLFPNITQVLTQNDSNAKTDSILKDRAITQQESIATGQLTFMGQSTNPGVKIGNTISFESDLYRITKVNHSAFRSGLYKNNFEAVPNNPKGYPLTDINAFPQSASQVGVVVDNQDPESLGRIKVQFPWQKKQNKSTPWIRVVSMQAGSSGGMYRIPHVGDEVIVDFENGNAELPYTSGSLYNKSSPPPSGSSDPDNNITIWQIGGNSITINQGDNSITFQDNSESSIKLEGNGNITINAEANLNLYALKGELNIQSPTINIGNGTEPDLTNIYGKNITIHATQKLDMKGDVNLEASGAQTKLEGKTKAELVGTQISISGTAMTEIKGAQVKMN